MKNKTHVCTLHNVHTKNIISVFIKDLSQYAILKKDDDNNWWIVSFTFRKILKGKVYTVTVFNKEPRYWQGNFFFKNTWTMFSQKSFSVFKKIAYFEERGQIPQQYIKTI